LTCDYKPDIIFEWVYAKLGHYLLKLFPLFLDTVAEFTGESMRLLRRLSELRDYLVGLF
jgi:hypothetical protein